MNCDQSHIGLFLTIGVQFFVFCYFNIKAQGQTEFWYKRWEAADNENFILKHRLWQYQNEKKPQSND